MNKKLIESLKHYPRNMTGYGRDSIHPHWPNKARVALQFVLNYEEGGENCVLHGDKASEAFLSEIVGAQPYDGVRHMSMVQELGCGECSVFSKNLRFLLLFLLWQ